jgi:hypothetical protein
MIAHPSQHKGHFYYYLRLMGKDIKTDLLRGI